MTFTLSTTSLFGYANDIVVALLPVAYLVGGIGLGFTIINRIISAFR